MGLILQKPKTEAPEVEDAIYDARFDGVTPESHPDWAGTNKFGGQDDGERWRFAFTLLEEGAVLYDSNSGNPVVVDVLTNQTMGKKSNAYAIMSGILTKPERDAVDAGESIDSDGLVGRLVQVVVEHNDKGWPKVASVIPARKGATAPTSAAIIESSTTTKSTGAIEDEDDEEAALLAQIEARKAAKAAAETKPAKQTKADKEAAARAERIRQLRAELEAAEEAE